MLASRLFQPVDRIEYGHTYDDAVDALFGPQLDNVCNLVHIKLTLDADDDIEDYVRYMRLHLLMLSMESFNTEPEESIPHDAIPFPVLRHLQFCFRDSIDDDTLFRGNAATLGTLETAFPPSVVPMLIRHNVFTPVSHPMLRFVGA
ncbi:hypothetical protein H4218_003298 [Coemansia sp. IMI 209128]|nr:hypothetical protein H4218_003298 [Coemansia sp. IMI 209128]